MNKIIINIAVLSIYSMMLYQYAEADQTQNKALLKTESKMSTVRMNIDASFVESQLTECTELSSDRDGNPALSQAARVDASDWNLEMTGQSARHMAWYVTFEELHVRGNNSAVYVDVRGPASYTQNHIVGSMNIAPHQIKTKNYLKNKNVVLIGKGVGSTELESLHNELIEKGFEKVMILDGGLAAWRRSGGELEGDALTQQDLNYVSASEYMRERDYDHWVVVDISDLSSHQSAAFERAFRADLAAKLLKSGRKLEQSYVLVVSEMGDGYARIVPIAKKLGNVNLFYLKGGRRAYDEQVKQQVAMLNRSPDRIGEPPRCGRQ